MSPLPNITPQRKSFVGSLKETTNVPNLVMILLTAIALPFIFGSPNHPLMLAIVGVSVAVIIGNYARHAWKMFSARKKSLEAPKFYNPLDAVTGSRTVPNIVLMALGVIALNSLMGGAIPLTLLTSITLIVSVLTVNYVNYKFSS